MSPAPEHIRHQLKRLLASPVFTSSARLRRFLEFVVEKTLAGEGDRLKEYVIGVEVFDRDAQYDPRVDSIVRVEAARLRTKLAEYYHGEGRDDAVVLTLPKGGYAPVLTLAQRPAVGAEHDVAASAVAPPPDSTAHGASRRGWTFGAVAVLAAAIIVGAAGPWTQVDAPRIAVLPFVPSSADVDQALAARLTEGVTAALVRTGTAEIVASSTVRALASSPVRARDLAAELAADVLIEANVARHGDRVSVEARAVRGDREQKFWVESFAADSNDLDELEREIAAAVTASLAAQSVGRQ